MTDKKQIGRPKKAGALTGAERQRKFIEKRRLAARPAYLASVAASLARHQSALAAEVKADPQSWFVSVLTKRVAALEDLIRKLTAPILQPDEAARSAYIASVAAQLARCQSALANEARKNPQGRFVSVFAKRVAALTAILGLPPQSSVTAAPRRGRTG